MLPAALYSIALLDSLLVQTLSSAFAGAWLFFHLWACAILLYNQPCPRRSFLWKACLAWALVLTLSAFIIHPVLKAAATMWILLALPSLALCLRKETLLPCVWGFGMVISLYAIGLVLQMLTHTQMDPAGGTRYGWPLLDPNNGAAIVNCALIPCLWLTLKDWRWSLPTALFAMALYATGSKAGFAAGSTGGLILLSSLYGEWVWLAALLSGCAVATWAYVYRPELVVLVVHALQDRFPIWWCSWLVLKENLLRGTGLGTYGMFRIQQGLDLYIPPTYAHNDLLQFAVEMGVPAALVFCGMVWAAARATCRQNIVSGAVLAALFLQALTEFQFYVPAVSLLAGLALGWHNLNDGSRPRARPAGQFRFNRLS
jgi:hypothetical protein